MSKAQDLKDLNAKAKTLREEQKALREELAATADERKEARKVQALARKESTEQKATLRELTAKVWGTFSAGDKDDVTALADSIMEAATELAGSVRKFGESLEGEVAEEL